MGLENKTSAPLHRQSRPTHLPLHSISFPQLANPQFPTRQLRSQTPILLSEVIRHNEITPDLFILQAATAFLNLHCLALKAAHVETPMVTATTVYHSSSFNNLLADFKYVHIHHSHPTTAISASPVSKSILEITFFSLAGESKHLAVH